MFFVMNEKGKLGLVSTYIHKKEMDTYSLNKSILNSLKTELMNFEIMEHLIKSVELKAISLPEHKAKSFHFGIVYQIELITDEMDMKTEEQNYEWVHLNKIDGYKNLSGFTKRIFKDLN